MARSKHHPAHFDSLPDIVPWRIVLQRVPTRLLVVRFRLCAYTPLLGCRPWVIRWWRSTEGRVRRLDTTTMTMTSPKRTISPLAGAVPGSWHHLLAPVYNVKCAAPPDLPPFRANSLGSPRPLPFYPSTCSQHPRWRVPMNISLDAHLHLVHPRRAAPCFPFRPILDNLLPPPPVVNATALRLHV